jgi:hypothetical protein
MKRRAAIGVVLAGVVLAASPACAQGLRGAKAWRIDWADQPTKFELLINLKAAKSTGLTIPPAVLVRADQILD